MKQQLLKLLMATVDAVMAAIPRPVPDESALRNCKIISHRGEFDNRKVMENTLPAFLNARAAGVWGIECDIRFTRDGVPVICHDADTARVFGRDILLANTDFVDLREALPAIPTLEELIAEFGGNTHLMLEVKEFSPEHLQDQRDTLAQSLAPLQAGEDFHILSLDAELFTLVNFLPPSTFLPVAETNVSSMSQLSLERGYRGLSGHYLLLTEKLHQRHANAGQIIATGFPRSRNCLYRELRRGIEWIFTNDAVYLQEVLNRSLSRLEHSD
jgi:glycerophosphoryl diester phosphodiesterase